MNQPSSICLIAILAILACPWSKVAASPTVSNVRSAQRQSTQLVDIYYDLSDSDNTTLNVSLAISDDRGTGYEVPARSLTGAIGREVKPGTGKRITWDAGVDWPNKFSANVRFRVTVSDETLPSPPKNMVLIPAGKFDMGDPFNDLPNYPVDQPVHSVFVSAFYIEKYEVTKALWDEVRNWGLRNGYELSVVGNGRAPDHPVQMVSRIDTFAWCNARSEMEGRVPAYYTDSTLTVVCKTVCANPFVNWNSGYRLPTEAEWEKAARGRTRGHRFPWSDVDTITHDRANYFSDSTYSFDVSPTQGLHPTYADGLNTSTSPVGSFPPNDYGLFDMAGNVAEWCWDWFSPYSTEDQTDPRGPAPGSFNAFVVVRGGGWNDRGAFCRSSTRGTFFSVDRYRSVGFRCALPQTPP